MPTDTPDTTPSVPTVATAVLPLLQTPPETPSLSVVVEETQTVCVPEMEPGSTDALTVTIAVAAAVPQLLVTTYDMVVVPSDTPATSPDVLIVAIPVALLLQVPPEMPSLSKLVEVGHTISVPVIAPAFGSGFTVITCVAAAVPQLLVTV